MCISLVADLIKAAHLAKGGTRHHSTQAAGGRDATSTDDGDDYASNNNGDDNERMVDGRKKTSLSGDDVADVDRSKTYDFWIYDSDANNKVGADGEAVHLGRDNNSRRRQQITDGTARGERRERKRR